MPRRLQDGFSDPAKAARGRHHRLFRYAAALHIPRRGPCRGVVDDGAGRLQRRASRRHPLRGCAAGARRRGARPDPRLVGFARHLCRPQDRRPRARRQHPPRRHGFDHGRDLAFGHARLHRAHRPRRAGDRDGGAQPLFRLPGAGDRGAWRRGAEIYRRRAARDFSRHARDRRAQSLRRGAGRRA